MPTRNFETHRREMVLLILAVTFALLTAATSCSKKDTSRKLHIRITQASGKKLKDPGKPASISIYIDNKVHLQNKLLSPDSPITLEVEVPPGIHAVKVQDLTTGASLQTAVPAYSPYWYEGVYYRESSSMGYFEAVLFTSPPPASGRKTTGRSDGKTGGELNSKTEEFEEKFKDLQREADAKKNKKPEKSPAKKAK